jgi:hypothetical protein
MFRLILGLTCGLLIVVSSPSLALGVIKLSHWGQAVPLTLQHALSITDSRAGQAVNFILTDHLIHDGSLLPAGSRFLGKVDEVRSSQTLAREGYYAVSISQFCTPNGKQPHCLTLEANVLQPLGPNNQTPVVRLYRPDIQWQKNQNGVLQTGKNIAITGLGFVNPIAGLVVSGVDGVGMALLDNSNPRQGVPKKVAKGLWQATGIPGLVRLFRPGQSPTFVPNQVVQVVLPAKTWQQVFQLAMPITQPL